MVELLSPAPKVFKPNPILKWVRTNFLESTMWRLPKTPAVLDLCCGYGFYFNINPKARAVDGDPACVEYLKSKGFDVQQCDVLRPLPFKEGEFEFVIAHDVCEHFKYEQLQIIFREVHRVLKPGGAFMVIVPNKKGYDYGLRIGAGHHLFVTLKEIETLRQGLYDLKQNYAEPLPRGIGQMFTHNKEVFELVKV